MDLSSLIGTDNISDFLSDGVNLFKKTINNLFDTDLFGGLNEFDAIVISDPTYMTGEELRALGFPGGDVSMGSLYKKFKVRILGERTPHSIFGDPCELFDNGDPCNTKALVASHTTVIAPDNLMKGGIGSYVRVHLTQKEDGSYNLHVGFLVKAIHTNNSGKTVLQKSDCELASRIFNASGEAFAVPTTVIIPTIVSEAEKAYEAATGMPFRAENDNILNNFNGGIDPVVKKYVKALLYIVWNSSKGTGNPHKLKLVSGTRSWEKQNKLYNDYVACENAKENGVYKDVGNIKCPKLVASAPGPKTHGTSGHGLSEQKHLARAVDIHLYNNQGVTAGPGKGGSKVANRTIWTANQITINGEPSSVVSIAKGLGFTWGGFWKSYDPVHFEITPQCKQEGDKPTSCTFSAWYQADAATRDNQSTPNEFVPPNTNPADSVPSAPLTPQEIANMIDVRPNLLQSTLEQFVKDGTPSTAEDDGDCKPPFACGDDL
jgi:hypothetical protein